MPGKLESLGVHNIVVGRGNSKDDAVWLRNVFRDEVPRLLLDIRRLVADGNLERGGQCQRLRSRWLLAMFSLGRDDIPWSSRGDPRE